MGGGAGDQMCYVDYDQEALNRGYGSSLQYLEELGELRRLIDSRYDFATEGNGRRTGERADDPHYREIEIRVGHELATLLGVSPEDVLG